MKTAPDDVTNRQLTVRLPGALYRRAQQIAKTRRTSLNALVTGLLAELDRRAREEELAKAYALLGRDKGSDVGFALKAQAEVGDE